MTTPVMNPVERARADLVGVEKGFSAAHAAANAALTHARDVAKRANGQGFAAIARGVLVVAKKLEEVARGISDAASENQKVVHAVASVRRDANPDEVLRRLHPAYQQLTDQGTRIVRTSKAVKDAEAAVRAALTGGQPGPLLEQIGRVRQILQTAHQQTESARRNVEAAMKEARSTGN